MHRGKLCGRCFGCAGRACAVAAHAQLRKNHAAFWNSAGTGSAARAAGAVIAATAIHNTMVRFTNNKQENAYGKCLSDRQDKGSSDDSPRRPAPSAPLLHQWLEDS